MTINDTDRTSISARTSPFTKYRVLTKPLLLVAGAALIAGCTATGGSGSATSTTATGSGSGAAAPVARKILDAWLVPPPEDTAR